MYCTTDRKTEAAFRCLIHLLPAPPKRGKKSPRLSRAAVEEQLYVGFEVVTHLLDLQCVVRQPLYLRTSWCYINIVLLLLICDAMQTAVIRLHVVCPSVTFRYRDHIGLNSSKIISPPNSLRPMHLLTPNMGDLVKQEHPQN